ncbi:LA2681 family HEPN domain-containing protein [Agrobacterium tumefaciens]|uniref:LA2681 family HEPN domain-containing protein n=1 Tax=Agrobacterium tumefaciens TaxID=358 RepID=UPI00129BE224|nr:LA2681 family HEPN domain-containing protein [Agrobacterium tumefaciens]MRH97977.1 hypothetical protein [Agrobacterium tumefaciens]WCK22154.1 LA2681 family HEPN domain-containing protein [Agrobacterium tumefaciens]
MSDREAFAHIGDLIDDGADTSHERAVKRGLYLLDDLSKRDLVPADGALVEYFRANAWAAMSQISNARRSWAWDSPETQEEMLALSRACGHPGFRSLDPVRRCQILTNHANLLNVVGRTIDAIAGWDAALKIIPHFAVALGNRGCGLAVYARLIFTDWERAILALHAYDSFRSSLAEDVFYDSGNPARPMAFFDNQAEALANAINLEEVRAKQNLDIGREGKSRAQRAYRRWCLKHRLFLCPLNDLGPYLAAAADDLMLPPLMERFDDRPDGHLPPPIVGFFSQMKQEYASARFMLFEGMSSTRIHFSDRDAILTDTLDYPHYSLASERVRTAFRVAYSLLDKVAFLVDRYWNLKKVPERISFKNVWMVEGKSRLLPRFAELDNLPLRGLYWLSKELFDDQLRQTTAADARELHVIRNALEHTYLRVSEGWAKPLMLDRADGSGFGISIGSDELEAKAIRIMQMARSALLHVSLAIGVEERKREIENPGKIGGSMPLYLLAEKRKRPDPI